MFLHLSVILSTGGWVSQHALGQTPTRAGTPLGKNLPPRQTPPWQTPPEQTPPMQTLPLRLCRQPPGQTLFFPFRQIPPPTEQTPPETATAADGKHPTGMHSC